MNDIVLTLIVSTFIGIWIMCSQIFQVVFLTVCQAIFKTFIEFKTPGDSKFAEVIKSPRQKSWGTN
ncbi:hypothetical protein D3C87_1768280 [compost metagenome]